MPLKNSIYNQTGGVRISKKMQDQINEMVSKGDKQILEIENNDILGIIDNKNKNKDILDINYGNNLLFLYITSQSTINGDGFEGITTNIYKILFISFLKFLQNNLVLAQLVTEQMLTNRADIGKALKRLQFDKIEDLINLIEKEKKIKNQQSKTKNISIFKGIIRPFSEIMEFMIVSDFINYYLNGKEQFESMTDKEKGEEDVLNDFYNFGDKPIKDIFKNYILYKKGLKKEGLFNSFFDIHPWNANDTTKFNSFIDYIQQIPISETIEEKSESGAKESQQNLKNLCSLSEYNLRFRKNTPKRSDKNDILSERTHSKDSLEDENCCSKFRKYFSFGGKKTLKKKKILKKTTRKKKKNLKVNNKNKKSRKVSKFLKKNIKKSIKNIGGSLSSNLSKCKCVYINPTKKNSRCPSNASKDGYCKRHLKNNLNCKPYSGNSDSDIQSFNSRNQGSSSKNLGSSLRKQGLASRDQGSASRDLVSNSGEDSSKPESKLSISDENVNINDVDILKKISPIWINFGSDNRENVSKKSSQLKQTEEKRGDYSEDQYIYRKKAIQYYLDGIHDFHINIFKLSEQDAENNGYDLDIISACMDAGFTSMSTLESDYLQAILRGDDSVYFDTSDPKYLPNSRVKCVWSNDINVLEKHFMSALLDGKSLHEGEKIQVLFDMGSNLSKFNNFKMFSPSTKLWDSSSGPKGGLVDYWKEMEETKENIEEHDNFSDECFSHYYQDFIRAGCIKDSIFNSYPYLSVLDDKSNQPKAYGTILLGNEVGEIKSPTNMQVPAKKFNVDSILSSVGRDANRNLNSPPDPVSKKTLDNLLNSILKNQKNSSKFQAGRMIKHSGDTIQIISSIILQHEKFRNNFSKKYLPYLYTEDLIAFANGINYFITDEHRGKKYANVFTITENANYVLGDDGKISEENNGKGGYYLIYTQPKPIEVKDIIKSFYSESIIDQSVFNEGEIIEFHYSEQIKKYFQFRTPGSIYISILFDQTDRDEKVMEDNPGKYLLSNAYINEDFNQFIKILYINNQYIKNRKAQYEYNFNFVNGKFPMSGGSSTSPSIRVDEIGKENYIEWLWNSYLPGRFFINFKRFMKYGFQYFQDFSILENFCSDFENNILNKHANILFLNQSWYQHLIFLKSKICYSENGFKKGISPPITLRGDKKVYSILPLVYYFAKIGDKFKEWTEGRSRRGDLYCHEPKLSKLKNIDVESYLKKILNTGRNYTNSYKILLYKFQLFLNRSHLILPTNLIDSYQFMEGKTNKDYYLNIVQGILNTLFKIHVIIAIVNDYLEKIK